MTYQTDLLANRYACIATQIGHTYKKPPEWMWQAAWGLYDENERRQQNKGKPATDDHLKQITVKKAKEA